MTNFGKNFEMEKKITPKKQVKSDEHPFEKVPESELNDVQKTQLLLDSKRLLDHTEFIREFKSWEFPSLD